MTSIRSFPASSGAAAIILLIHGCARNDLSVHALFLTPPSRVVPYPSLRLTTADRLGVSYEGIAEDAGKAASLPGFALSLDAEFGTLPESTFEKLKSQYCAWSDTKSRVKWDEGREYTLLDFLPPIMQAVSGKHFQSTRSKQKNLPSFVDDRQKQYTEQEVLLTSNCWGFAWEVLFQADNPDTSAMTVSTADPTSAWRAFTGPGFDLIQSSMTKPKLLADKNLRNRRLQGGDVLLLWHTIACSNRPNKVYLDHVVTCIDEDVYFEKSGSGDNVPYRINTWEGIVANFPPVVFNWEWRRLVRRNRNSPSIWQPYLRLKPASEIFGVDARVAYLNNRDRERFDWLSKLRPSVAKQLSLTTSRNSDGAVEAQTYTGILVLEDLVFAEDTGRASLPASAFDKQSMKLPRLPSNPYE
eukprot:CAMPEP_0172566186 /NCGR_PEP_ID=MMETSP1067-20121228/110929_1 /TAXON_ID=265564 ORGANISM="Thalassiosira punctigera, Strain Tpunct2005C2" /NCGR_SAMPLE_ID=MMETSP1067 /ASSEMBLY_ACC=CAM_ASM_000444 /LENGTH=411 /DNA_ID=CAMNT_0013357233 /DNA_START=11 /DNA_END=1246 /DNA_ORIENTATION=-